MKRIVKETLRNGDAQYRVETNIFLGFIPCKWHTDLVFDVELDMHLDAIFDSYDEALIHCGKLPERLEVVNRDIIKEI